MKVDWKALLILVLVVIVVVALIWRIAPVRKIVLGV